MGREDRYKRPFQLADPKSEGDKPDFKALLADLKDHGGRLRHKGMFYWLLQDAASIGRKPAKWPKNSIQVKGVLC